MLGKKASLKVLVSKLKSHQVHSSTLKILMNKCLFFSGPSNDDNRICPRENLEVGHCMVI